METENGESVFVLVEATSLDVGTKLGGGGGVLYRLRLTYLHVYMYYRNVRV